MNDFQGEGLTLHQAEEALESDIVQMQTQLTLLVDFIRLEDVDHKLLDA